MNLWKGICIENKRTNRGFEALTFLENSSEKFDITVTLGNITKIVEDSMALQIFSSILKICNLKKWNNWIKEIKEIVSNFKDKSFKTYCIG